MHLEHFEDLPFTHGNEGILLWETLLQDGFTTIIEEKIDGSPAIAFGTEGGIPWVGLKSAFGNENNRLYSEEEIVSRFTGKPEIVGAMHALLDVLKSKYMPYDRDVKYIGDLIFSPQNIHHVLLDGVFYAIATPNVIQYQSQSQDVFDSDYTICVHTANKRESVRFIDTDTTQQGEESRIFFTQPRLWKISIDVNGEKVSLPYYDSKFSDIISSRNSLVHKTIKKLLNFRARQGADAVSFVDIYRNFVEESNAAVAERTTVSGKGRARERFNDQLKSLVRNRKAITEILEFRKRVVREAKEGIISFAEERERSSDKPIRGESLEGIVVRHEVGPDFKMVRRDVFSRQNHEKHMGDK